MIRNIISIIVPVYNVKEYLDKCVSSILAQTYTDIELILVDDGSTDGSGELCDTWAEKDDRVVVIHKENAGSADSRNRGLEVAHGQYIGFVDSDDWTTPNMYHNLIEAMRDNDSDISICMFEPVSNEDYIIEDSEYKIQTYSGREFANIIISEKKPRISYAIWKCLYKREVVKDLRFYKGVHYNEDAVFLIESLWKANKVSFIDSPMYYYRVHESSISNVCISDKRINDILFKCKWLMEFYGKNASEEEQKIVRGAVIRELIPYLRVCWRNEDLFVSLQSIYSFLKDNNLNSYDVAKNNIKESVKYYLYMFITNEKLKKIYS